MLKLRYEGVSSATGLYKALRLVDIGTFFDGEQTIKQRLHSIEVSGQFAAQVREVKDAIGLSKP